VLPGSADDADESSAADSTEPEGKQGFVTRRLFAALTGFPLLAAASDGKTQDARRGRTKRKAESAPPDADLSPVKPSSEPASKRRKLPDVMDETAL
jgi:hypothetical protein